MRSLVIPAALAAPTRIDSPFTDQRGVTTGLQEQDCAKSTTAVPYLAPCAQSLTAVRVLFESTSSPAVTGSASVGGGHSVAAIDGGCHYDDMASIDVVTVVGVAAEQTFVPEDQRLFERLCGVATTDELRCCTGAKDLMHAAGETRWKILCGTWKATGGADCKSFQIGSRARLHQKVWQLMETHLKTPE